MSNIWFVKRQREERSGGSYMKLLNTLSTDLEEMLDALYEKKNVVRYTPEAVLENDRAKLYWDRSIITDRTILANKPDIVLLDRAESRVFLVDVNIPYDENLVPAEVDKKTK